MTKKKRLNILRFEINSSARKKIKSKKNMKVVPLSLKVSDINFINKSVVFSIKILLTKSNIKLTDAQTDKNLEKEG